MSLLDDDAMESHGITGSNFTFQAAPLTTLAEVAQEFTLATMAVDVTGSVMNFADDLRNMLVASVEACRRNPLSSNLLVRVVEFSGSSGASPSVRELHGFKPLHEINTADYPAFHPDGGTPLYDATYSALGATLDYGRQLVDNDFPANGIVIIVTDGGDNTSRMSPTQIRRQVEQARLQEQLESVLTILIGINATKCRAELEHFQREAGLDIFIDAGDVTPARLAKVAGFISQSISSQSQALGTGGPSQAISATI